MIFSHWCFRKPIFQPLYEPHCFSRCLFRVPPLHKPPSQSPGDLLRTELWADLYVGGQPLQCVINSLEDPYDGLIVSASLVNAVFRACCFEQFTVLWCCSQGGKEMTFEFSRRFTYLNGFCRTPRFLQPYRLILKMYYQRNQNTPQPYTAWQGPGFYCLETKQWDQWEAVQRVQPNTQWSAGCNVSYQKQIPVWTPKHLKCIF